MHTYIHTHIHTYIHTYLRTRLSHHRRRPCILGLPWILHKSICECMHEFMYNHLYVCISRSYIHSKYMIMCKINKSWISKPIHINTHTHIHIRIHIYIYIYIYIYKFIYTNTQVHAYLPWTTLYRPAHLSY